VTEMSGKDRRALRALGHHLKPVVQVGQHGITPALIQATEEALATHELIKVRILEGAPVDRKEAATGLAEGTGAELAQLLGRTFLLYKPHPEKPKLRIGTPPEAALHGHVGGEGDRPAARKPRRAITQGAEDEGAKAPRATGGGAKAAGRKAPEGGAKTGPKGPRRGTGAALPPRRHRS